MLSLEQKISANKWGAILCLIAAPFTGGVSLLGVLFFGFNWSVWKTKAAFRDIGADDPGLADTVRDAAETAATIESIFDD